MSSHNIPFFNMKKKNTLNYSKSADMGFLSKGLKTEFERAVVNETSVFEPLKFYCISLLPISVRPSYSVSCKRHQERLNGNEFKTASPEVCPFSPALLLLFWFS